MQHEHAMAGLVLFFQHLFGQQGLFELVGVGLVALLDFRQIAQQLAHLHIGCALGGALIEAGGLELHVLRFLADGFQRQVGRQPDRPATQEALHILAADGGQHLAKAGLVDFEEHMAVAGLLLRHLLEDLGGGGIALAQILGEGHVDARVLFLGGNGEGQDFAWGQFGKGFHRRLHGILEGF